MKAGRGEGSVGLWEKEEEEEGERGRQGRRKRRKGRRARMQKKVNGNRTGKRQSGTSTRERERRSVWSGLSCLDYWLHGDCASFFFSFYLSILLSFFPSFMWRWANLHGSWLCYHSHRNRLLRFVPESQRCVTEGVTRCPVCMSVGLSTQVKSSQARSRSGQVRLSCQPPLRCKHLFAQKT